MWPRKQEGKTLENSGNFRQKILLDGGLYVRCWVGKGKIRDVYMEAREKKWYTENVAKI